MFVRRRKLTLFKLVLIISAVIGVLFWVLQIRRSDLQDVNEKNDQLHVVEFKNLRDEIQQYKNHIQDRSASELHQSIYKNELHLDLRTKSRDRKIQPNLGILKYPEDKTEKVVTPKTIDDGIMKIIPGLGENGVAVHLSKQEQKEADKLFNQAAFNVYLSNRIALNRSVPDPRHPSCKKIKYDKDLPTTSVVIIFTNEVWSALLRTIYSVFNRTPNHLLKEIILVDDASDREELKEKLQLYIEKNFPKEKIKLIRMPDRQGLIRARLAGAHLATGDVLVFLDSHCETNEKWLEPLLQRIKEDRKAVLCPIIDVIDDKTLEYYSSNGDYFQIGGFNWNGHFTWIEIPEWEEDRRGSAIAPTRTPTMAGGLFAIERRYFWEIGSYDSGMDIWGGENLEMSFRVWMCGGTLEIVPCSHVGHIFRNFHPYKFPGNKDTHGINTVRTIEVWMDQYKEYFYMHRPDLKEIDYGDVEERIYLRKRLKCKTFQWYLENIYPQKFIVDQNVIGFGTVRNPVTNLCLDTLNRDEDYPHAVGLFMCKSQDGVVMNQLFSLSNNFELRREENCAEVNYQPQKRQMKVMMIKCHGRRENQEWQHVKGGPLVHVATGKCLDITGSKAGKDVHVAPCHGGHSQIWWFEKYTDINAQISFKTEQ